MDYVGTKKPNAYGLYDMVGNVSEWCNDRYNDHYYKYSSLRNPTGPDFHFAVDSKGYKTHLIRGGSWLRRKSCRVSTREYRSPGQDRQDLGFRCVIDVDANGNPQLNPEGKIWDGN